VRIQPATGRVAHGIAGDGVYVDGVQIAKGEGLNGLPDWWGDRVIWCSGEHGGVVSSNADGSDLRSVTRLASMVRASAAGWAAWMATGGPGGGSLTWTSWGLELPGSLLLDMAPDGTLLVGDSYQRPGGISAYAAGATERLWRVPDAQPASFYPYPQASIVDAQRAAWTEPSGRYGRVFRAHGLPALDLPWSALHPTLCLVDGDVWVTYLRQPGDQVISHPWAFTGRGLVGNGTGYGPVGSITAAGDVALRWSRTAAEAAGDIVTDPQDPQTASTLPPAVLATPEPDPIVPIDRALWFGFFEFAGPTACLVNCRLSVVQGVPWLTVRDLDGRPLYRYVAGDPDGDPDAIDRAVVSARAVGDGLDVLAYVPRGAATARLPNAVIAIECYRRAGESVSDFEAYVRHTVARCPRAVLIAQCYTSNQTLSSDVRSVPPVIARIARGAANVEGVLVFSGSGRATGYQDHPEVQPDWVQVAATIRTPVVTAPPQPIPPGLPQLRVTIDHYTPGGQAPYRVAADYHVEGHGHAAMQVYLTLDGQRVAMETDPAGQLATVVTEPGEYRLGAVVESAGRKAQTGATRIVRVTARPDLPAPPPVGDNDPAVHLNRTAAADTVRLLYLELLNREPDPSGLAHYVDALMAGTLDSAGLRAILTNAKED
jgi:hypothetical protein